MGRVLPFCPMVLGVPRPSAPASPVLPRPPALSRPPQGSVCSPFPQHLWGLTQCGQAEQWKEPHAPASGGPSAQAVTPRSSPCPSVSSALPAKRAPQRVAPWHRHPASSMHGRHTGSAFPLSVPVHPTFQHPRPHGLPGSTDRVHTSVQAAPSPGLPSLLPSSPASAPLLHGSLLPEVTARLPRPLLVFPGAPDHVGSLPHSHFQLSSFRPATRKKTCLVVPLPDTHGST
ncbi:splicing factor 3A subunit 2-like [Choloepus didactylus]|uniref:splicing factor 3A subunit 2-like n=1 Tax=Choloepus didactylus TaxID=27675 RepID=UPI00189CD761|nr:splicing factor 3A subunit 2-like [Choloepus didactylus]